MVAAAAAAEAAHASYVLLPLPAHSVLNVTLLFQFVQPSNGTALKC